MAAPMTADETRRVLARWRVPFEAVHGWRTRNRNHVGAWGPVKPTKKTFESHFLDIVKVGKDDKVERVWSYANNYELLRHLGYWKTEVVHGDAKTPARR